MFFNFSYHCFIHFFFLSHKTNFLFSSKETFSCPVSKEYCEKGKVVQLEGKYFAIAYKLPAGETVKTIFGGKANLQLGFVLQLAYALNARGNLEHRAHDCPRHKRQQHEGQSHHHEKECIH